MSFHPKGHDGKTADLPGKPTIKKSPVISKNPYLARATSRCGNCRTSQQITGRPGTSVKEFICRSCKTVNKANDGRGFTFEACN